MKKFLIISLYIMCSSVFSAYAYDEITFTVPNFQPYTYKDDGKIKGIGVDVVTELLDEMKVHYKIKFSPNYGRALDDVKKEKVDGFFLASQNAERDNVAVFSSRVAYNNWSWFFPAESTLNPHGEHAKANMRVATTAHTNTHKWLVKDGYQKIDAVQNTKILPKFLLELKRAEAIFLAEMVFISAANDSGVKSESYRQVVEISKPFGIYVSKKYLAKNEGFMEDLNRLIEKIREP